MATQNYTITGMTCGHCVNAVTEEVSEIDGVTSVDVQLEGGRMTVESDQPVDLTKITAAVEEAGDYVVALA
ncbi:heavy-metal-associated domain-containing protein [Mariniluteicoccus endophyticus]